MYKVKNDIDLKELEKFGFKKEYYEWNGTHIMYRKEKGCYTIGRVDSEHRILLYDYDENPEELFADLIQAGLVEKVKE